MEPHMDPRDFRQQVHGAPQGGASPQEGASLQGGPSPQNAPFSQPPAPQQAELQKHHVHHSYIWLGSIRTIVTLLVVMVATSFSSLVGLFTQGELGRPGDGLFMLWVALLLCGLLVAIIGIVVAYQFLSYRHLYFTLGPDEFNLHKGIISKRRVHVPYQRVQSVDQNASLLQRIFGVCTVSIDTAGGSSNKAIQVPYLTKQQAEWLRAELFARKRAALMAGAAASGAAVGSATFGAAAGTGAAGASAAGASTVPTSAITSAASAPAAFAGAPVAAMSSSAAAQQGGNVLDAGAAVWQDVGGVFAGASLDTGRITFEYGLSNKELVLTGLSSNTAFAFIVLGLIGVVAQIVELVFDLFPKASESFVEGVAVQATSALAGSAVASMVAFSLGVALAVMVVLWLVSGLATCISYGGFRARRRDNRIEMERGLLQHTFQGVDVDRVQAVVIKQTFIRRLIGYCEISLSRIDAAENSEGSQQSSPAQSGVVVHPFVKMDRVPEILAGIIPEYSDLPTRSIPVPPVALRRALVRRCLWQGAGFWLAACVALAQLLLNVAVGAEGLADALEMPLMAGQIALGVINRGAIALYVIAVVLTIISGIGAFLWFRESSFAYNRRFMQISLGGFSRQTTSFPRQKIQYAFTRTNPFQRLAHTATVNVRTAAGIGGTSIRLIDAAEEDACAWLAWVKPGGGALGDHIGGA